MRLIVKRQPGFQPRHYDLTLRLDGGDRGQDIRVVGDGDVLAEFLENRLSVPRYLARQVASEASNDGGAYCETDVTVEEVRQLNKLLVLEQKTRDAEAVTATK